MTDKYEDAIRQAQDRIARGVQVSQNQARLAQLQTMGSSGFYAALQRGSEFQAGARAAAPSRQPKYYFKGEQVKFINIGGQRYPMAAYMAGTEVKTYDVTQPAQEKAWRAASWDRLIGKGFTGWTGEIMIPPLLVGGSYTTPELLAGSLGLGGGQYGGEGELDLKTIALIGGGALVLYLIFKRKKK